MKSGQTIFKDFQPKGSRNYGSISSPKKHKVTVWKLFSPLSISGRLKLVLGILCGILHGASRPLLALLFGMITNSLIWAKVTGRKYEGQVNTLLIAFVILGVATFFISLIQATFFASISQHITSHLKTQFLRSILIQDASAHKSQTLRARFTANIEGIGEGTGIKFSLIVQNMTALLFGCCVSFYCSWQLTLLLLLLTTILLFATNVSGKLSVAAGGGEQQRLTTAHRGVEQCLSALPTVAAFGGQRMVLAEYERELHEAIRKNARNIDLAAISNGAVYFLTYVFYGLTLWFGSFLFIHRHILPGYIFTVIFIGIGSASAAGNLASLIPALLNVINSAIPVFEVIEAVDASSCPLRPLSNPTLKGHVQIVELYFNNPLRPQQMILSRINLDLAPGTWVGIVGGKGSGKSTLLNLLLRLYKPSRGRILLDGVDLQEIPCDYVRGQLGVVTQDPTFFSDTIGQNIKMGGAGLDVAEACREAGADEFISLLPQKYETVIAANDLSTSERQRLALARALIGQPRILILDEPTADLDPHAEPILMAALENARKGRTAISLTRNSSTVQFADIIYFLKDGEIVEAGRYEQLMRRGGFYFNYVQTQMQQRSALERVAASNAEAESMPFPFQPKSYSKVDKFSDKELRRMLHNVMRSEYIALILGLLSAAIMGLFIPATAFIYGEIIQVFIGPIQQVSAGSVFWAIAFLILAVIAALATTIKTKFLCQSNEDIGKALRIDTVRRALSLPFAWFDADGNTSDGIMRKLSRDIGVLRSAYTLRLLFILVAIVTLVVSLILAFVSAWPIAVVLLLTLPLLVSASYMETNAPRITAAQHSKGIQPSLTVATEAINHLRTVQILVAEAKILENYKRKLKLAVGKISFRSIANLFLFAFSESILCFVHALAFYLGSIWLDAHLITVPDLYKAFLAMVFSASSLGQILSLLPDHTKAKDAATSIFSFLKCRSEIDPFSDAGAKPELTGSLTCNDVQFAYNEGKDVVFKGLTFDLEAGKTLGLICMEGIIERSSLCQLIARFYDVHSGAITIDGWDVRDINVTFLRSNIGFVCREPKLFDVTIWENIAFGYESTDQAPIDAVVDAVRRANAYDFILAFPQGFETVIGEEGVQLSVGQKIRIEIARALIRNPKILLLDLPTMDEESPAEKRAVASGVESARRGRTCVILSNSVSAVDGTDAIGVVQDGKIKEYGTKEELLSRKGVYYNLSRQRK